MKIKSLLIGSAAAIVAAPAMAADVIIAEPEPVEYVEVCDVAGAGYFYIPGSRTCLQIGGLVRHELQFGNDDGQLFAGSANIVDEDDQIVTSDDVFIADGENDGIDSLVRAELTVRTYTETELGALTSYFRFRADDVNSAPQDLVVSTEGDALFEGGTQGVANNGSVFVTDAVIGLGGLLLGRSDTLFDGGIAGEFDGFGGGSVHFIRYVADLGAFSAGISLEAEREFASRFDYVPNVVANVSGDVGAFSVDLWAAYDDEDEIDVVTPGFDDIITGDDEFAFKVRAGADLGVFALEAAATYHTGENFYDNGYEFSVGASATVGLGERASLTFGGQYFGNELVSTVVDGVIVDIDDTNDDSDAYSIGANLDYEIVEGFSTKVAVTYADDIVDNELDDDDDGILTGFIRFDRTF